MRSVKELGSQLLAAVLGLKDENERQTAIDFLDLPSRELYPDYYQIIASPISLNGIRADLEAENIFKTLSDVNSAIVRVCLNAHRYNEKCSQIWDAATRIKKICKLTFQQLETEQRLDTPNVSRPSDRHSTSKRRFSSAVVDSPSSSLSAGSNSSTVVGSAPLSFSFKRQKSAVNYEDLSDECSSSNEENFEQLPMSKATISALERTIAQQKTKLEKMKQQLDHQTMKALMRAGPSDEEVRLLEENDLMMQRIKRAAKSSQSIQDDLVRVRSQKEGLEEKVKLLEARIDRRDKKILESKPLSAELKQLKTENKSLRIKLDKVRVDHKTSLAFSKDLKAKHTTLQDQLTESQEEVKELKIKNTTLAEKSSHLEAANQDLIKDAYELKTLNRQMTPDLFHAKWERDNEIRARKKVEDELAQTTRTLSSQLVALQSKHDALVETHQTHLQALDPLSDRVNALLPSYEQLHWMLQDLGEGKDQARARKLLRGMELLRERLVEKRGGRRREEEEEEEEREVIALDDEGEAEVGGDEEVGV